MRTAILTAAHDLLSPPGSRTPRESAPTLDEIATCAGISRHHLSAYYTSICAIKRDLNALPLPACNETRRSFHALD